MGHGAGGGQLHAGQGAGAGQGGGGGHSRHNPALTFTIGDIQGGHFSLGGNVDFLTYALKSTVGAGGHTFSGGILDFLTYWERSTRGPGGGTSAFEMYLSRSSATATKHLPSFGPNWVFLTY